MRASDEAGDPPVEGLNRLYADREPPGVLEERIVDDLRRDGLLADEAGRVGPASRVGSADRGSASAARWLGTAAAATLIFAAGWVVGTRGPSTDLTSEPSADFMLLLWETAGPDDDDSSGGAATEYAAWARGIAAGGTPVSGEELGPERTILGSPATQSPGARIGGFFMIRAETAAEARRVAESHPHLTRGGWIEVAPVVGGQHPEP